ncbi:MAG: spore coat protein U domain-containing protein [Actinomycetota bacterium]|nr:spore coat protein U domain-containing protein [Actinomycetota bacterium]
MLYRGHRLSYIKRIALALCFFLAAGTGRALAGTKTSSVAVSASVPSGLCQFITTTAALNFGNLNPANPVNVNATASLTFLCFGRPVSYAVTHDGGLHNSGGQNRMINADLVHYLPYSVSLNPTTGTANFFTFQTVTVTGTVAGLDYQNAQSGNYSDTLTVTVTP